MSSTDKHAVTMNLFMVFHPKRAYRRYYRYNDSNTQCDIHEPYHDLCQKKTACFCHSSDYDLRFWKLAIESISVMALSSICAVRRSILERI